jgi:hypothetical protein
MKRLASALVSPLHKMQSTLPMVSGSNRFAVVGHDWGARAAADSEADFCHAVVFRRVGGRYQTVPESASGCWLLQKVWRGKFMNLIPVNPAPLISLLRFCYISRQIAAQNEPLTSGNQAHPHGYFLHSTAHFGAMLFSEVLR